MSKYKILFCFFILFLLSSFSFISGANLPILLGDAFTVKTNYAWRIQNFADSFAVMPSNSDIIVGVQLFNPDGTTNNYYIKIFVISRSQNKIIREYQTSKYYLMQYLGSPYPISSNTVIIPLCYETTTSAVVQFIVYNIETGSVNTYTYTFGSSYIVILSNIVKCGYDNNYYILAFRMPSSGSSSFYLLRFTGSSLSSVYSQTISTSSISGQIRLVYNGSASPQKLVTILPTNPNGPFSHPCSAQFIILNNIAGTPSHIGPFTSQYTDDYTNDFRVNWISWRTWDINGHIIYNINYVYYYSEGLAILKSLFVNGTSGTNWGVSCPFTINRLSSILGSDGEYEDYLHFYAGVIVSTYQNVFSCKVKITGRPLNPQFELPYSYQSTFLNIFYQTYFGNKYRNYYFHSIKSPYINGNYYWYESWIQVQDLPIEYNIYDLSVTINPDEYPMFINKNYQFQVLALRNGDPFKSVVRFYDNNIEVKTIDTSNGYNSFYYSTTVSGYHNFTFYLYDLDYNTLVKTLQMEKYFAQYQPPQPTPPEGPSAVIVPFYANLLTQILPILILLFFPVLLLAKYMENKSMAVVAGLAIGIFLCVYANLIPIVFVYLFILVMILLVFFAFKRSV